jgi:(p)ppGpp synthase/HD superfamily hydrolase
MEQTMIYEKALALATEKHKGQLIKGTDRPYIEHPTRVAVYAQQVAWDENMSDEAVDYIMSVAVLHDVLEDTDCTQAEIEILDEGWGRELYKDVLAVTNEDKFGHNKSQQTLDALIRIIDRMRFDPRHTAAIVKMCDRAENISKPFPAEWGLEKRKAYREMAEAIMFILGKYSAKAREKLETALLVQRARPNKDEFEFASHWFNEIIIQFHERVLTSWAQLRDAVEKKNNSVLTWFFREFEETNKEIMDEAEEMHDTYPSKYPNPVTEWVTFLRPSWDKVAEKFLAKLQ